MRKRKIWALTLVAAIVVGLVGANAWGVFQGNGSVNATHGEKLAGFAAFAPLIAAVLVVRRRRKRQTEEQSNG